MKIRIASAAEIEERTTRKFHYLEGDYPMTGLLARHDGKLVAYANRCQHRPLSLDWDDGEFYDQGRENFVCRTHGAVYEPLSGLCLLGPCAGDVLESLPVSVVGDDVFVEIGP